MTGLLRPIALFFIRAYQLSLSPLFHLMGLRCRYTPTCSQYAAEAFRTHPMGKAFLLTAKRLSSCRPFGGTGYDPVPPACCCGSKRAER
ncbi:MAG: membrane protein insertion efficiency factor YidD [Pseudomonadota bacterium]